MYHPSLRPRRRWPLFLPFGIVVVLAVAWSGLWFYAANRAQITIDGWRAREAQSGRVYACADQSIGGFPFRIEVTCTTPSVEVRDGTMPVALQATSMLMAAQIYDPTLLIGEFTGPVQIGEAGQRPTVIGNWRLAATSVRGTPREPERVSIVLDEPRFDRMVAPVAETLVTAKQIQVHGRIAQGSVRADPVLELALSLAGASAPGLNALAAQPFDADISGTLTGLKNFSAKPWTDRLREVQAAGGGFEITKARIAQGEVLAVATGTLRLSPAGRLDGQLQVTVAGVEKMLALLGVNRGTSEGGGRLEQKLAPAFGALDRIAPGLGNLAREKAGPTIAAGLNLLGEPTMLEGQRAVTLPLRFSDGAVTLGPIPIGNTPELF